MPPLSPDEQRVFDCLADYWETHGYSPGIQDLVDGIREKGRKKVQDLLRVLREKKYIDWQPNRHRSYRILVEGMLIRGVIQAGLVIQHPDAQLEWADVPGTTYRSHQYALRVCGDSMIDAQINDGNLVMLSTKIDLWTLPKNAIAAVWVEATGATLKHIEFDGESVFLKPANPNYPILKLKPDEIQLQGVFIRVLPEHP